MGESIGQRTYLMQIISILLVLFSTFRSKLIVRVLVLLNHFSPRDHEVG